MVTTYEDSKGRTHEIGSMAYTYLKNAANKLRISGEKPDVLEALDAEIYRRDQAFNEQQAAEAGRYE